MHTLMFIVASLLLFLSFFNFVAAFLDDPFPPCNGSVPLFPESKGEEIHALLPRDRYINFVGWIPGIKEYQRLGPEKIPYGYLKEMLLHFESISDEGYLEARIFLTSMEKNETIYLHEIYSCNHNMKDKSWEHDYETHDYCPLREQFIKFKIFKDGVKVENVYISKDGKIKKNMMQILVKNGLIITTRMDVINMQRNIQISMVFLLKSIVKQQK